MAEDLCQERTCNIRVKFEEFSISDFEGSHVGAIWSKIELFKEEAVLLEDVSDILVHLVGKVIVSDYFSDAFDDNLNNFS